MALKAKWPDVNIHFCLSTPYLHVQQRQKVYLIESFVAGLPAMTEQ